MAEYGAATCIVSGPCYDACMRTNLPLRWTRQQSTETVQLRPYQEESILRVLEHLERGERRLGISLATGGGKTVIFSHLIDRIPSPRPKSTQTLILAHRRELVEQAARHCRNLYPERSVEIEMGVSKASGTADITIASVQSITSGERLLRYDPSRFKLLLVDEAHHIVANSYLEILRHFQLLDPDQTRRGDTALVGVSATLTRSDGLKLGEALDHIVYHKDYAEMIEEKWLANVKFTTVHSGADLSKVKTARGDFQTGALSKAVNSPEINEVTVRSWIANASDRKSTLVFCVDLDHVSQLTAAFRAHGYDAHFITGDTQAKIRTERLASFKAKEFPVLLNCAIFTEGTDISNIDCILLARPTKSTNLLIQMMGRGLRLAPGKEDCHVIDMVASLEKGIVTTPTLFGLDPSEVAEHASADEMKERKTRKARERERDEEAAKVAVLSQSDAWTYNRNITFTHYDSVGALIEDAASEQHIRGLSPYAWVQVDHARYILSNNTGSYLTLNVREHDFVVMSTIKSQNVVSNSKNPYWKPITIATSSTFGHAIRAGDSYAKKHFVAAMLLSSALWRQNPATYGQLEFLNEYRDEESKLNEDTITKGRAADLITKIKHGARGLIKKFNTAKAREEKARHQEEEKREREEVKVGPIRPARVSYESTAASFSQF